eukprot:COSAG02_NODE_5391_length_4372_cov_4.367657_2_plen_81_part_00
MYTTYSSSATNVLDLVLTGLFSIDMMRAPARGGRRGARARAHARAGASAGAPHGWGVQLPRLNAVAEERGRRKAWEQAGD